MYDNLFAELEKNSDAKQAVKMAAYMQNKFKFLGLPKPKLTKLINPFLKESKNHNLEWKFINFCWAKDYREAQYFALEYLRKFSYKLTKNDLPKLKKLIVNKSWWDTIDALDTIIGDMVLKNPELEKEMLLWSKDKNIWLRRVAIDHQLLRKENTNTDLLEKIIVNNFGSNEFFINKAIGWSLRDYSKYNPQWVKAFIEKYQDKLAKLSLREGSKYLT